MIYADRNKIIDKINHFAARKEPFLFAVDFHAQSGFVLSQEEAVSEGILYEFNGHGNIPPAAGGPSFQFDVFPVDIRTYEKAYDKVLFHLRNGDTYLLNLTFPTRLETDRSPRELFLLSQAPYRLHVPGHFAVFSPEAFVFIRGNEIVSRPMKGTIRADVPDAGRILLGDKKEFFEHNTIVDLIRNDLSMVSTDVTVRRFRYLERIHTNRVDLLQMSSEVSGKLPDDYRRRLGEILFTLLPAGSVTGAPKERTVEIILETEGYDRGFYTGIFGRFDGESLVSAVSIRYIEQTDEGLVFKSGGGITAMSDMHSEYNEMVAKVYVPVV
ncbi:MAG: aminodeoxychorismate synthase component I [Bacteroidetes bacterium]|nr:aminodeoxychorismate synthase component I [Bacteroidota bacterium]